MGILCTNQHKIHLKVYAALLLNGSTLILRHVTRKYVPVCADLMESNEWLI